MKWCCTFWRTRILLTGKLTWNEKTWVLVLTLLFVAVGLCGNSTMESHSSPLDLVTAIILALPTVVNAVVHGPDFPRKLFPGVGMLAAYSSQTDLSPEIALSLKEISSHLGHLWGAIAAPEYSMRLADACCNYVAFKFSLCPVLLSRL